MTSLRATIILSLLMTAGCEAYLVGDNSQGQLGVTDVGDPWVVMEAGAVHTCGVTTAGGLWCWGDNSRGQTGNGTTSGDQLTANQVGTETDWRQVAPGYRHTCGIRAGQIWCWGSDLFGQLGNGGVTTGNQGLPVRVGTNSDWTLVASGWYHSCGIRNDGELYCWGLNSDGQLGVGDVIDRSVPTMTALSPWKDIDGGRNHTCGVRTNGVAYCWGSNSNGQIGSSSVALGSLLLGPLYAPGGNIGDNPWTSISAGDYLSCGIREDKKLQCWGQNDEGQIADGSSTMYSTPRTMDLDGVFLQPGIQRRGLYESVSAGADHVCGIKIGSDDIDLLASDPGEPLVVVGENRVRRIKCFGSDEYGQMGLNEEILLLGGQVTAVSQVTTGYDQSVSAGLRHTVVLSYEE